MRLASVFSTENAQMDSIVVVEDEPQILELLTDILEMYGYRVLPFPNADLAWRYFQDRREAPQLLITDLNMPGQIDGVGLVERVHRKFPTVPIVVASGYHIDSDSLHIDRVFWLTKPFTVDQVSDTCQMLVPQP